MQCELMLYHIVKSGHKYPFENPAFTLSQTAQIPCCTSRPACSGIEQIYFIPDSSTDISTFIG
jgi:hypothetical protein